ncbi:hypothetical protein ACJX0J_013910, partial [Zea mays]
VNNKVCISRVNNNNVIKNNISQKNVKTLYVGLGSLVYRIGSSTCDVPRYSIPQTKIQNFLTENVSPLMLFFSELVNDTLQLTNAKPLWDSCSCRGVRMISFCHITSQPIKM